MKILHIISGDIFAGAEMQVLQTLYALKKRSEKINYYCILFNCGLLEQRLKNAGIFTFIINEKTNNVFAIIWKVSRMTSRIKPNLIHVHRAKEHFVGFFSQLLNFTFKPIVRTVHGLSEKTEQSNWYRRFKYLLTTRADRFLIRFLSNTAIAVSNDMYYYLKTLKSASGIFKLYNTIDCSDYTFPDSAEIIKTTRQQYSIGKECWVGSAARLAEPKNQKVFVEAAHLINGSSPETFRFSIFGDGPLRDDLQSRIAGLHLSGSFFLHGFIQNIVPAIASFDIFILCSLHEGLPMALLEAMALGKPVICTATGGMKEVITNHQNGILIPSNDPAALAESIKLLYYNQPLRQFISENARKHVQHSYSIEKTTDSLINHYRHCAGRVKA